MLCTGLLRTDSGDKDLWVKGDIGESRIVAELALAGVNNDNSSLSRFGTCAFPSSPSCARTFANSEGVWVVFCPKCEYGVMK